MTPDELARGITIALSVHTMWHLRLRHAITAGIADVPPLEVRRPMASEFAEWLCSPAFDDQTRATRPYKAIWKLHEEFHEHAADVMEQVIARDPMAARALLDGPFHECSSRIYRILTLWRAEVQRGAG